MLSKRRTIEIEYELTLGINPGKKKELSIRREDRRKKRKSKTFCYRLTGPEKTGVYRHFVPTGVSENGKLGGAGEMKSIAQRWKQGTKKGENAGRRDCFGHSTIVRRITIGGYNYSSAHASARRTQQGHQKGRGQRRTLET